MQAFKAVEENLLRRGYTVRCFAEAKAAADYLDSAIDGKTVGFGGSMTLQELGLYERLCAHNRVYWHWRDPALRPKAAQAQVYLSSVNALAESGELINIDGAGNRVASTLYGHERVYFVVGCNKLAASFEQALWRARNIAAPKNAQRLQAQTPCAEKGERCYDCQGSARICRGCVTLWGPMMGTPMEVILIGEPLGY